LAAPLGPHLKDENTWDAAEEIKLYKQAMQYKDHDWELIAEQMPEQSAMQCAKKYQRALNNKLVDVAWSPEEDMQLRDAVELCGESKQWGKIAVLMKNKSGGQCSTRWHVTVKQESKK
jgi:Myb-like DNA-binding domain